MRDDSAVRAHGGAKARWTMLGMMAAVLGVFAPMVLVETVAQAAPTVGPCSGAGVALDSFCVESSANSPTQPPYDTLGITKGDRINEFKWLVNADDTGDPSLTAANVAACLPARAATNNPAIYANAGTAPLSDCPWPSVHTSAGHSAVVSSGDQTQVAALNNLPVGKYLISVTAANHKIDGVHFTVVPGNAVASVNDIPGAPFVVTMNPMPKKTATLRVHVYNDNASTNGQWDGQTETLLTCADSDPTLPLPAVCNGNADPTTVVDPKTDMSGFSVSIADVLATVTTDVYNNPLCTQYVEGPDGILLDNGGAPIPLMFGNGGASGGGLAGTESTCLSDHYGDIVIPNMGPNRYAVSVTAPDPRSHNGQQWVQTTTLEGGHDWDSWNIEGGTGYDTELIVGGERVTPIAHGFVRMTHSDAERATMTDAAYYNAAPGFNGGAVGHGVLTGRIRIGRAYVGSGGALALAGTNITNAKQDGPIEDGLISISCLATCNAPTDTTVWTGRASAVDGSFTVTGLQTGDYSVAFWDESQSYIMSPMAFHIDGSQTQAALPTVLSAVRSGLPGNRVYTLTFNANPNLLALTPVTLASGNNGWSGTFRTFNASSAGPTPGTWTVRVTALAPTPNPGPTATVMPQAFGGPSFDPPATNISDVLLPGWFTDLQGSVFVDTNADGIRNNGEKGVPDFGLTVRTRGNSLQDQGAAVANTDDEGAYDLSQAYPLGQFLIAEAYNPRFKSTGYSYWTDNDPGVHAVLSGQVDVAFLPVIGLAAHLDWGVQPYVGDENGGIVGTVSYDVTRNEFDPAYSGPEDYQPSVSGLPVQLWKTTKSDGVNPDKTASGAIKQTGIRRSDGTECVRDDTKRGTDAVQDAAQDCKPFDYYITETFARPTGCMALDVNGNKLEGEMALPDSPTTKPPAGSDFWSHSDPTKPDCIEAPMNGFQIGGDGTVDGNYALTNLVNSTAITTAPAGGDPLASFYLDTKDNVANWDALPSADYVVEVVNPDDPYNNATTTDHNVGGYFANPAAGAVPRHLYRFTDETAINVMTGNTYVPQGGYGPSGDPAGGDYLLATSTIGNIRQDVNTLGAGTVAKCAGSLQTVDQSNNPDLTAAGGSPYVGTNVPVCDSKLVKVVGGRSVNPTFFVYTDVPIPSKFYGLINDDLNLQTDRRSILLGEVAPVANGPVGIYDENGNWKYTSHSDVNGFYEVILPSMDTYNCPLPAGPCPNVYRLVGNDPGTLDHRNLDYNPQFRTIATEFQAWTGVVHPVDQAPTHQGITIEGPAAQFGALSLCKVNDANTLATQMTPEFFTIDKPYFNPASDSTKNYVVKGSGFGASVGTLTLGNAAVTVTAANWTDNQLTFQIPAAVASTPGPYQLAITNSASGLSTVNGLTFHSLATDSSYYRITDVYEVRSNDAGGAPILRDNAGSRIYTPMHDAWDTVDQTGPGGFSGIDNNPSLTPAQRQVTGGRAIQRAIEAAHGNNGSTPKLIVIYPNTAANYAPHNANAAYFENVVIHGQVKLQGVGPGGAITSTNIVHGTNIDASQFWSATQVVPPGGNQQTSDGTYSDDWRTFAAGLDRAGDGPVEIPEGEGVLAIAESTNQYANLTVRKGNTNYDDLSVAKSIFQNGVDGILLTGGDQQGNPGNVNTTPGAVGDVIGGVVNPGPAQGGAIMLDQYVRDFNITNNQIQSNGGTYGTIRVGTPDLGASRAAQNNHNQRLNVANNRIVANGGTNLAGALGLFFGADRYTVTGNDFCGNFSAEYGGAVSHYGSSPGGLISKNRIYYNQGYDEGGGIFIAGNLPGNNNALSLGAGGTWVNGFTGNTPNLVTEGVTVDSNTLISNQSNDDGGGIRFLMGGDFPFLVKNNVIANNLSTHEGGGVALDDTMNVTLANNTIVKNVTTATAATNSGINTIADPNTKPANPAGLSTGGNSTLFQASLPNNSPNWSKPKLLNNIFADNRAGWAVLPSAASFNTSSLHGVELADAQRWDVGVPSDNGLCNAFDTVASTCGLPFGFDVGGFNTTNAVAIPAHANVGAYSYLGTDNFPAGSDGAGVGGIGFKNPQDFAVDSLMWRGNTAVSYPVIVAHMVPVSLLADYHLVNAASLTYAVNVGGASYLSASPSAVVNAPTVDIDGDARPAAGGYDRGADEIRGTTANLSISKDDGVTLVSPGQALTYTITVHNGGPDAVTGAVVTDTMPATLTSVTWTCAGICTPASGSGNISATVDLANGANATFTVHATVAAAATGSVVNTATVAAPFPVADPVPGNNSATDTDSIPPLRPTLTVLDPFTRANANNLGANWTQFLFLGQAAIRVNANQASDVLVPGTAFWNGAVFGAKQGAAMTIANATLNGDALLLKASGTTNLLNVYQSFIRVRVTGSQVVVETTTNNGGVYTTVATLTGVFANGNTITAQVDATGRVDVWNGTTWIGQAATGVTGTGRIGFQLPANARSDNFAGGTLP